MSQKPKKSKIGPISPKTDPMIHKNWLNHLQISPTSLKSVHQCLAFTKKVCHNKRILIFPIKYLSIKYEKNSGIVYCPESIVEPLIKLVISKLISQEIELLFYSERCVILNEYFVQFQANFSVNLSAPKYKNCISTFLQF